MQLIYFVKNFLAFAEPKLVRKWWERQGLGLRLLLIQPEPKHAATNPEFYRKTLGNKVLSVPSWWLNCWFVLSPSLPNGILFCWLLFSDLCVIHGNHDSKLN